MGKDYVPRSAGYIGGHASAILLDARRRAGLTQDELAKRAGVHRPLISLYENGKKDPTVNMLARLIDACDMELRMRADELTDADRSQYEWDRACIESGQARRNADRVKREVVSVRKLTPEELEALRRGDRAAS